MSNAKELQARVFFLTARLTALSTQTLAGLQVEYTQKSAAVAARILTAVGRFTKGMGDTVGMLRYSEDGTLPADPTSRRNVQGGANLYDKETLNQLASAYFDFAEPIVETLLDQAADALAKPASAEAFGDAEGEALDLAYLLRTKGEKQYVTLGIKTGKFTGAEGLRLGLGIALMDDACKLADDCDSLGFPADAFQVLALKMAGETVTPLQQALSKLDADIVVSVALPAALKAFEPVLRKLYDKAVEVAPELKVD